MTIHLLTNGYVTNYGFKKATLGTGLSDLIRVAVEDEKVSSVIKAGSNVNVTYVNGNKISVQVKDD